MCNITCYWTNQQCSLGMITITIYLLTISSSIIIYLWSWLSSLVKWILNSNEAPPCFNQDCYKRDVCSHFYPQYKYNQVLTKVSKSSEVALINSEMLILAKRLRELIHEWPTRKLGSILISDGPCVCDNPFLLCYIALRIGELGTHLRWIPCRGNLVYFPKGCRMETRSDAIPSGWRSKVGRTASSSWSRTKLWKMVLGRMHSEKSN